MNNFRQHKRLSSGFTTIPNQIFMDKRLSLKGIGMLCRLLSLPPDWIFSEMGLTKISKEGRDGVRSALKELEDTGYLFRERVRDENGKMKGTVYHIYEIPLTKDQMNNGEFNQISNDFYYDWMTEQ